MIVHINYFGCVLQDFQNTPCLGCRALKIVIANEDYRAQNRIVGRSPQPWSQSPAAINIKSILSQ
jgi:hypothetical protein